MDLLDVGYEVYDRTIEVDLEGGLGIFEASFMFFLSVLLS